MDLSGNLGANIFSLSAPLATGSSRNTDTVTASVTVNANGLGALTSNDYVLSFVGGTPKLTNTSDGTSVTPAGAGTAASPYTAAGISIVLSGTPANGDQFLVQPTATAAAGLKVVLSNPSQIAAASAIKTAAAGANTGAASISAGTVQNSTNPNLRHPSPSRSPIPPAAIRSMAGPR